LNMYLSIIMSFRNTVEKYALHDGSLYNYHVSYVETGVAG